MANIYYGTGCPKEVRDLFEFLEIEHKYEVSKFRNLDRPIRTPWGKTEYWKRRANNILYNYATTKVRRE